METWSIRKLCKEIITKFGVLECDLTEVYTAMLLFHTIPVTSAAAERSSKNEAASNLDLSEIIDEFEKIKARKRL
ncbi:unnamed protein product [Euphydryas editha]|uniref:Uncharacterized protein n=1 Tax=Euphydryas editha TaxID=104508 RepID=A0AAU9UBT6_EUPED|nr:unnamed protein product [Euphydryas editha]